MSLAVEVEIEDKFTRRPASEASTSECWLENLSSSASTMPFSVINLSQS